MYSCIQGGPRPSIGDTTELALPACQSELNKRHKDESKRPPTPQTDSASAERKPPASTAKKATETTPEPEPEEPRCAAPLMTAEEARQLHAQLSSAKLEAKVLQQENQKLRQKVEELEAAASLRQ